MQINQWIQKLGVATRDLKNPANWKVSSRTNGAPMTPPALQKIQFGIDEAGAWVECKTSENTLRIAWPSNKVLVNGTLHPEASYVLGHRIVGLQLRAVAEFNWEEDGTYRTLRLDATLIQFTLWDWVRQMLPKAL